MPHLSVFSLRDAGSVLVLAIVLGIVVYTRTNAYKKINPTDDDYMHWL